MTKSDYYTKVCDDLEQLPTLTQRLDYWKDNIHFKTGTDSERIAELFSTKENQISPLNIPESIWLKYIRPLKWKIAEVGEQKHQLFSEEYNDWMTDFYAKNWGNELIFKLAIDLEKSGHLELLIDIELKKIEQFELAVIEKASMPTFRISDFEDNVEEYEYFLFMIDGYKGKEYGPEDGLVKTIGRYKYFKPHLQKLIGVEPEKENKPQTSRENSKISSEDKCTFSNIKKTYSFEWIGNNQNTQISKLYFNLSQKGYIPDQTDPKLFLNAFQKQEIKKPYNIRWIKEVKGKLSKPLLFYFISELEVKKLIEPIIEDNILFNMVENIFADPKGEKLIHLRTSKRTSIVDRKTKTPQEKGIDEIINQIT